MRRRVFLALPLAGAAIGTAGCGFDKSGSSQPGPTGSGGGSSGGLEKTFRVGFNPPNHLNPALTGGGSPEASMMKGMMWEGLVKRDPSSTVKYLPGAADTWEISKDALTYTFHIREGSTWSNGDPLTAEDFVWSYQYLYSADLLKIQGSKYPPRFTGADSQIVGLTDYSTGSKDFSTVGIKAPDKQTLVFTLTGPRPRFMNDRVDVLPLHKASVTAHPKDFWLPQNLVANGPYLLTQFKENASATFTLNKRYWDAGSYTVTTQKAQFNAAGSTGMMVSYNADELDLFRVDGDPAALITGRPELKSQLKHASLTQWKGLVTLPSSNPVLLQNPKVRQALALALDRDALAQVSPPDVAGPSWIPSGITDYDKLPKIPYDPAQAKQLLAEAGFAGGKGIPPLKLLTYAKMPVLEAVASMWKKNLGIQASVDVQETGIYTNMVHGQLPKNYVGFWFAYEGTNPPTVYNLGSGLWSYTFVFSLSFSNYQTAQTYYNLRYGSEKDKQSPTQVGQTLTSLLEKNWVPEFKQVVELSKKVTAAAGDMATATQLALQTAKAFQDTYLYIPMLWSGYSFMQKPRIHNLTLMSEGDAMYSMKGVTLDATKA